MTNPKVSILIPVYNAEKWLPATITSALTQTWPNTEIIIVDDGSSDNSLEVAKSYESGKLKVISQKNMGQSAAENKALQEAQGDLIQYLDADDLLAFDKIENQIIHLGRVGHEFVATSAWARFYNDINNVKFEISPLCHDLSPVDWLVSSWTGGFMMPNLSYLIPRRICEAAGGWREQLSLINDHEYFCRIILASKGVTFCADSKCYYRSGMQSSLSATKGASSLASALESIELASEKLLSCEYSERTKVAAGTVLFGYLYSIYPKYPQLTSRAMHLLDELRIKRISPKGSLVLNTVCKLLGWKAALTIRRFFKDVVPILQRALL